MPITCQQHNWTYPGSGRTWEVSLSVQLVILLIGDIFQLLLLVLGSVSLGFLTASGRCMCELLNGQEQV